MCWLHSAKVVWEEAQSSASDLSLLPSAHFRHSQPGPALPTPPSLKLCPKPCWSLVQKIPNMSLSWITVNTDIPNPTKNYFHRNYYRKFPFLLEQHSTKSQLLLVIGERCVFRDAGSLQLPSAVNLAMLAPTRGLRVGGGLFSWVFFPFSEPLKSKLTLENVRISRICWQGNHNDQNSAGSCFFREAPSTTGQECSCSAVTVSSSIQTFAMPLRPFLLPGHPAKAIHTLRVDPNPH